MSWLKRKKKQQSEKQANQPIDKPDPLDKSATFVTMDRVDIQPGDLYYIINAQGEAECCVFYGTIRWLPKGPTYSTRQIAEYFSHKK